MGKFFDIESPFMSGLNKMADLMILNLITLVCCLPIITIGASFTALHFVALKIVRNEETYILKTFFKSFKENFVQSTLLWLIQVAVLVLLIFDFLIINHSGMAFPSWVNVGLIVVSVLLFALALHIFPLQAKFVNPIRATMKNSVLVGMLIFPKTVLEMIVWAVPIWCLYSFAWFAPIWILFGFSAPAMVCALLYNKTFKKFEPQTEEKSPDDWTLQMPEDEEKSEADSEAEEDDTLMDSSVSEN